MTPLDFITHVEQHNEPVGSRMKAIKKPLVITDGVHEYVVLSYYPREDGCMVIDIERKP